MKIVGQLIIAGILVLSCLVVAYATDRRSRIIQGRIKDDKARLSSLKRSGAETSKTEISRLEKHLSKLEKELSEVEQSSLLPMIAEGSSLSEKLRASLPLMIAIIMGAIGGALLVVFVPVVVFVVIVTMAIFGGSLGLLLEFTGSEKKAVALAAIPTTAYALTQAILLIQGVDAFNSIYWLFDITIVFALIGVSIILGKQLPIEIVIILVLALSVWDIIAVIFTEIMATAVSTLNYTLPILLVEGAGLGGGDLLFSYLLVTTIARKLRSVPLALIGLIAVSLLSLVTIMYVTGAHLAPALPAVSVAGVLSAAYYRNRLKKQS